VTLHEERLRLADDRRLIFENFCNLVPVEAMAEPFARSIEEIEREILFVGRKIREYRHRRCLRPNPQQGMLVPLACETLEDILLNRDLLVRTLLFIGPQTLSSELLLPNLRTHMIENADHLREAARTIRARMRETA
jgi:hypothetical protein